MLKAIKIRLYPSKDQTELINKNLGSTRFVYNKLMGYKRRKYETEGKTVSKYELMKLLPRLKVKYPFLKEVDSTSLQQSLIDMDRAYQNFFKSGFGFPKFRKRGRRDSFRCVMRLDCDVNKVKIGKHGFINFRCSARDNQELQSNRIRQITVFKEVDKYYATCLIEDTLCHTIEQSLEIAAIDVGVKKPVAIAYKKSGKIKFHTLGQKFSEDLAKKEKRRKKYQKQMSRKKKESKNREKAKLKVQKAFQKEKNLRKEFTEKVSHKMATTFKTTVYEDLNLRGMTKSCKGTVEKPGKNVKQKSGLNREMLRLGIGQLMRRTVDKGLKFGSEVQFVNPKFTSQKCSSCGHTDKENRVNQSKFKCKICEYTKNADYNAAKNILRLAA